MRENRCTHCHGKGIIFKKDGINKSDVLTCGICNGTCVLPEGYKKATKRKETQRKQNHKKDQDMHKLSMIEGV